MMELNILICGIGGQGVVFLGSFVRKYFLKQYPNALILGTESRGVSQREGSVAASVRIQTDPNPQTIFSPEVPPMAADIVIALEPLELLRNFSVVQKNTIILTSNEPIIPKSSVKWMYSDSSDKEAIDVNSHSKPKWLIEKIEQLVRDNPVTSSHNKIDLKPVTSKSSLKDLEIKSFSKNARLLDMNFSTVVLEELESSSRLNLVMLGFLSCFIKSVLKIKDILDHVDEVYKDKKIKALHKKAIQFGEELGKAYGELKNTI